MRALLDTCVLSEIRKPKGSPAVKKAVDAFESDHLFISVLSIAELAKGISLLDEGPKKRELTAWLHALERYHADRLLSIDLDIARIWGEFTAVAQKNGRVIPAIDGLIAATARRHGLHVMTRNVADFEGTGVLVINPWSA